MRPQRGESARTSYAYDDGATPPAASTPQQDHVAESARVLLRGIEPSVPRSMRDVLTSVHPRYAELAGAHLDSVEAVTDALRGIHTSGLLEGPHGPRGMRDRCEALCEVAALDLSLARLMEGHLDARAIIREAGRSPAAGPLYGVWAADSKDASLSAEQEGSTWRLRGTKRYCSGAIGLDRALVTARAHDGSRLFEVDLRAVGVTPLPGTWPAVGMAGSGSLDVSFDLRVPPTSEVGPADFYVQRRGFWHGSVGVAACWLGGAVGCARMLAARLRATPPDAHAAAHFGAIVAECHTMGTVLERAALEIEVRDVEKAADPDAHLRALLVRQAIEQGCQRVLTATGRASGSSPLAFDAVHARRAADLVVYLRQHHAERDLVSLARLKLGGLS